MDIDEKKKLHFQQIQKLMGNFEGVQKSGHHPFQISVLPVR